MKKKPFEKEMIVIPEKEEGTNTGFNENCGCMSQRLACSGNDDVPCFESTDNLIIASSDSEEKQ